MNVLRALAIASVILLNGCTFFSAENFSRGQSVATVTSFGVPTSVDMTWRAARQAAEARPVKRWVVRDDVLRIASWTEEVADVRTCSGDAKVPDTRILRAVALNLLWISDVREESIIHVRRVCYPYMEGEGNKDPLHSDGSFELEVATAARQNLVDELKRQLQRIGPPVR